MERSSHRQANSKQASIKDVARLANVSIATVSRCLNHPERVKEATRQRVLQAIEETGYSPNTLAQSFRRGKTQIIMVVLPSVGDPFFGEVMAGIRSVAVRYGYSLLINEAPFHSLSPDEIGSMIVSRRADGIILLASMSPYGTEILSERSQRALPIVIGCETISAELASYPSIHIDNIKAATEATSHLLQLGHRRIAFITGSHDSLLTRDREKGYRQAMQASGVEVLNEWIVEGQMTLAGAAEATRSLLGLEPPPTAIFCANDQMAMACIHEIRSAGLDVPQHVSVVGFDDIPHAAVMQPALTTIAQPAESIGRRVMERMLEEIEHGRSGTSGSEIVAHELVVRSSTGPPAD